MSFHVTDNMRSNTKASPIRKPYSCAPFAQRLTANGLYSHEHQVAAIKDGNGEQIDQTQIDGNHRHEEEKLQRALALRPLLTSARSLWDRLSL